MSRVSRWLLEDLDQSSTRVPLAVACFISGFIACVSFSACSLWVGFQTGNTVQVAMGLGRLAHDPSGPGAFMVNDSQALCSVASFAIAAQISGRLSPWTRRSRATISLSALIQALLTAGAAVAIYYCKEPAFSLDRSQPSWHNAAGFIAIGLLSASFGMQGVVGESLGTGFTATVVLTSLWTSLAVLPCPKRWYPARDDRILCILLFLSGSFVSRIVLASSGSACTLGVAAIIRLFLIPVWLMCKTDPSILEEKNAMANYSSTSSAASSSTAV